MDGTANCMLDLRGWMESTCSPGLGASRVLGASDLVEIFPGVEFGRLGALSSTRQLDGSVVAEAPTIIFRPN